MIDDATKLSALLSGDLPEAEAATLRARLEQEPALAELYATLQALPDALGDLPEVPIGYARPVVSAPKPKPSNNTFWLAMPVSIAATALMAFALGRATATPATLTIAGEQLALRGHAQIHVQEDPMNRTASALTLTLVAGTAWWLASGDAVAEPVPLTSPPSASTPPTAPTKAPPAPATPAPSAEDASALKRLRFENALLRGALNRHEGRATPWPKDIDPTLSPEGYEAEVWALVDADPNLTLLGTDCTEYPCVAWIESTGDYDAMGPRLDALKRRFETHEPWPNHWVWTFPYVQRGTDHTWGLVGIMVHDGPVPKGVATRLKHRVELTMEEQVDSQLPD